MNGVRFIALLSAVWGPLLGASDYSKQVLDDKPALYFRFDQVEGSVIKPEVGGLEGALAGNASSSCNVREPNPNNAPKNNAKRSSSGRSNCAVGEA